MLVVNTLIKTPSNIGETAREKSTFSLAMESPADHHLEVQLTTNHPSPPESYLRRQDNKYKKIYIKTRKRLIDMERSRGKRSKTRHKMRKDVRKRGVVPVTKFMQKFEIGDIVHIVIEPSIHKGQPHPIFHGKTGVIVEKRGRAYIVEVRFGNKKKKAICAPVHLRLQK